MLLRKLLNGGPEILVVRRIDFADLQAILPQVSRQVVSGLGGACLLVFFLNPTPIHGRDDITVVVALGFVHGIVRRDGTVISVV
jgi:hypothetical protein